MLNVKKLLTKILNGVPRQRKYTGTTFTNALANANNLYDASYVAAALDSVNTNIASLSTGVFTQTSGGPVYGIVLFKYSAIYYAGYVLGYKINNDELVYFKCENGSKAVIVTKPAYTS